jgi:hypothetical protein
MNKTLSMKALVLSAALAFSGAAMAHGSTAPEHGGIVHMSGETLFEVVPQGAGVAVYIKDDGELVNSANMTARLVVLAKGAKTEVALKPAGANKFEAAPVTIPLGARVAIIATDKTSHAQFSVTFTSK